MGSQSSFRKINIFKATKLAMEREVKRLKIKNQKLKIDFLIIDGNLKLNLNILQKSIVKADEKIISCAIASIIAKFTRDKIMKRYHKEYPQYSFNRNKGYLTKYHLKILKKYGPCQIHRKSFRPIFQLRNAKNFSKKN